MAHKRIIEKELEGFGIRLNKTPPRIEFRKKEKGGISVNKMVACDLDEGLIAKICHEYRVTNADIVFR